MSSHITAAPLFASIMPKISEQFAFSEQHVHTRHTATRNRLYLQERIAHSRGRDGWMRKQRVRQTNNRTWAVLKTTTGQTVLSGTLTGSMVILHHSILPQTPPAVEMLHKRRITPPNTHNNPFSVITPEPWPSSSTEFRPVLWANTSKQTGARDSQHRTNPNRSHLQYHIKLKPLAEASFFNWNI